MSDVGLPSGSEPTKAVALRLVLARELPGGVSQRLRERLERVLADDGAGPAELAARIDRICVALRLFVGAEPAERVGAALRAALAA